MKSLKLNNKDVSRLLELCQVLWPNKNFRIVPCVNCNEELFVQFGDKGVARYEQSIHWYEFCTRYLIKRIALVLDEWTTNYQSTFIRRERPIREFHKAYYDILLHKSKVHKDQFPRK